MDTITLKLDSNMLKTMDKTLKKNNFSTRTEFVRTAIREKLENMSRDELIQEFMKKKGTLKPKTNKSDRKIRDEAFKEYAKERGWDLK